MKISILFLTLLITSPAWASSDKNDWQPKFIRFLKATQSTVGDHSKEIGMGAIALGAGVSCASGFIPGCALGIGLLTACGTESFPADYFKYPSEFYKTLPINHFEQVAADRLAHMTVDGRDVYRFTVEDGDVQPWDIHNIGPGGLPNERCELSYAPAPDSQKLNAPNNVHDNTGVQTYTLSQKFEAGWPDNQRWAMLFQFHPVGSQWGFQGISVHGNHIDFAKPFDANGTPFYSVPIETDKWYDWQIVVNWTTNNNGYVKVYLAGKLVGAYNGPTAAAGEQYYIKQGYYRDGSVSETGVVNETPVGVSSSAP